MAPWVHSFPQELLQCIRENMYCHNTCQRLRNSTFFMYCHHTEIFRFWLYKHDNQAIIFEGGTIISCGFSAINNEISSMKIKNETLLTQLCQRFKSYKTQPKSLYSTYRFKLGYVMNNFNYIRLLCKFLEKHCGLCICLFKNIYAMIKHLNSKWK